MTNEEVIAILKTAVFPEDYTVEEVQQALDAATKALEQTKWIPVSERLPEKMGTYLVTLEYKEHGIGVTTLWFHGAEIGWDLRVADIVLAWMPLPKPHPYKESEETE